VVKILEQNCSTKEETKILLIIRAPNDIFYALDVAGPAGSGLQVESWNRDQEIDKLSMQYLDEQNDKRVRAAGLIVVQDSFLAKDNGLDEASDPETDKLSLVKMFKKYQNEFVLIDKVKLPDNTVFSIIKNPTSEFIRPLM